MNGSVLIAAILAWTAPFQDSKPTPPPGWSMQTIDSGWILKADGLASGKAFTLLITKREKAQVKLKEALDSLWTGLGPGAKRNEKTDEQTFGTWQTLFSTGVMTQGGTSLAVTITAWQKGEEQFSSITFADSVETHAQHAPTAGKVLGVLVGLVPAVPTPGAAVFEVTFPAGWRREDRGPLKMAHTIDPADNRRFRTIILMPPETVEGGLEPTFERIWNREMKQGGIVLHNPGLISPERPQPLRRRLKSGLVVLWEGGEGRYANSSVYTQLYAVPNGTTITPVLVIYGTGFGSTFEADRAPVHQFFESFKASTETPKQDLFAAKDCVGKWQLNLSVVLAGFYSVTGGYLGDASTGGIEDLTLKSDGSYTKFLVAKSSTLAWTYRESGSWKVTDDALTLVPKEGKPQKFRIYGRAMLQGKLNLLLGVGDDARIPTDALEAGCEVDIITRGSSLFRYVSHPD